MSEQHKNVQTLTKAEIVDVVYDRIGFSKREAADFVERTFDIMRQTMLNGESVKISGFGTFLVRNKSPRKGRNPKTGEDMILPGRRVATFRPSHILRGAINGEDIPDFLDQVDDEA